MGIPFPDPPVLASEVEVLDGLFQNLAASVVVNDLGHIQEAGELCFREWLATLRVGPTGHDPRNDLIRSFSSSLASWAAALPAALRHLSEQYSCLRPRFRGGSGFAQPLHSIRVSQRKRPSNGAGTNLVDEPCARTARQSFISLRS